MKSRLLTGLVTSQPVLVPNVIPVKTGIQKIRKNQLDSRFHGNDTNNYDTELSKLPEVFEKLPGSVLTSYFQNSFLSWLRHPNGPLYFLTKTRSNQKAANS